jgi:hypothetical protein
MSQLQLENLTELRYVMYNDKVYLMIAKTE